MEYTVHEAKSQLSKLLKFAESGEEVTIVRRGQPVVRLIPIPIGNGARSLGWDTGQTVPDDALVAMTDEEADAFLDGR